MKWTNSLMAHTYHISTHTCGPRGEFAQIHRKADFSAASVWAFPTGGNQAMFGFSAAQHAAE